MCWFFLFLFLCYFFVGSPNEIDLGWFPNLSITDFSRVGLFHIECTNRERGREDCVSKARFFMWSRQRPRVGGNPHRSSGLSLTHRLFLIKPSCRGSQSHTRSHSIPRWISLPAMWIRLIRFRLPPVRELIASFKGEHWRNKNAKKSLIVYC